MHSLRQTNTVAVSMVIFSLSSLSTFTYAEIALSTIAAMQFTKEYFQASCIIWALLPQHLARNLTFSDVPFAVLNYAFHLIVFMNEISSLFSVG